jgi:hypothetical protein
MQEHVIVESSFSAIINAPIESIDIPAWCFSLPDHEYQGCSPAHFAAGATTSPEDKRMSINVEVLSGVPMVQRVIIPRGVTHTRKQIHLRITAAFRAARS